MTLCDADLQRIKEEIKLNLALSQEETNRLDYIPANPNLSHVTQATLSFIGLVILTIFTAALPFISFLFGLFVLYHIVGFFTGKYHKRDAGELLERQLISIRRFVSRYYENKYAPNLQDKIQSMQLASLKKVDVSIRISTTITGADQETKGYEISPRVFIHYWQAEIQLKCDFRIIRNHMTQSEVAWVFQQVVDTLEGINLDSIEVVQYSSTKHFSFKKDYLDAGTINYMYTKTRSKSSQSLKRLPNSTQGFPKTPPRSSTNNAQVSPTRKETVQTQLPHRLSYTEISPPTVIPRDPSKLKGLNTPQTQQIKILLSDIYEKRRSIEELAMSIVKHFEKFQGRDPKDVSAKNFGFDILSYQENGASRKIEVKGLSTEGNVILTKNELQALINYKNDYFLYIVNNCLVKKKTKLLILTDLSSSEFQEDIVDYRISYHDLEQVEHTCN